MAGLVDTLGNVVHKSELSELILDLSNPQLKYGFLMLNGQPIEANPAYNHDRYIIIDWNTKYQ